MFENFRTREVDQKTASPIPDYIPYIWYTIYVNFAYIFKMHFESSSWYIIDLAKACCFTHFELYLYILFQYICIVVEISMTNHPNIDFEKIDMTNKKYGNAFRITYHWWPVDLPNTGSVMRNLMSPLLFVCSISWTNSEDAGDLRPMASVWYHCDTQLQCPVQYAQGGSVVICFCDYIISVWNSYGPFTHIVQAYYIGTGATIWFKVVTERIWNWIWS